LTTRVSNRGFLTAEKTLHAHRAKTNGTVGFAAQVLYQPFIAATGANCALGASFFCDSHSNTVLPVSSHGANQAPDVQTVLLDPAASNHNWSFKRF